MKKKILLIEDEQVLAEMYTDKFMMAGFEVAAAFSAEEGLDVLKAQKTLPDLILLDLVLPKLNGFEVLAGLKKDNKTKEIPIIILTNMDNMEDVNKALELGASTYLVKTEYDLEELVSKIKKFI